MNTAEARQLIATELATYRNWSYEQLCALVDAPKRTFEVVGTCGTRYYAEVYAFWDSQPRGDVRVVGCIDDGGWRAFIPISDSFIKAPDGSFVGEDHNKPPV